MTLESSPAWARISGFLYFIVIATGIYTFLYVPGQLTVPDNAAATIESIRSQELLYRSSIAALLLNQIAFFFLPLALYVLLSPTNPKIAQVMVLAALAGIPLGLMSAIERMMVLNLLTDGIVVTPAAIPDFVAMSRAGATWAVAFAGTFWGLWLLPFGYLVFRSGFLPRVLGLMLMAGCFGYLINLFGVILIPGYTKLTIASILQMPASLGEIGIGLWLLLIGARPRSGKTLPAEHGA